MEIFIGLDVSLASTSVCALNVNGETVNEAKVPSNPGSLAGHLRELPGKIVAVGLEAGPQSQWLHKGLSEAGSAPRDRRAHPRTPRILTFRHRPGRRAPPPARIPPGIRRPVAGTISCGAVVKGIRFCVSSGAGGLRSFHPEFDLFRAGRGSLQCC